MQMLIGTSSPIDRGSGINAYVREIVLALKSAGHSVTIAGPQVTDSTWLHRHQISLLPMNELTSPENGARTLIRAIASSPFDAIINNDNPYLQCIAPLVECPFLSVMHLGYRNIASLACFNYVWVDYLVAISNEMRFQAINKHGVPASKVVIIYNGIADTTQSYQGNPTDKLKVVFSGGDNHRKGFDLLFNSLVKFPDDWMKYDLAVFGTVKERYARRLCQLPYVTLHGRVTHHSMLSELANADVFLLPSRFEGCPMALIEAMAFGLVPITSDGEGAMDIMVQSGVSGFVCQLRNWDKQVIECLRLLEGNEQLRSKMRRESRLQYETRFRSEQTVSQLISLIETPTVDRNVRHDAVDLLYWHRPTATKVQKHQIMQRLRMRTGLLKHRSRRYPVDRLL